MGSFSIAVATVFILLISFNSIAANAGVENYKNTKPDHFMPGTVLIGGRIRKGFFLPPSPAANLKKGVGETPPIRVYTPPEPPSAPIP
ncbi:hypothetical protein FRX31_002625 [Thalictrum thalictroides]|uniref:Transmembrane protein n=1 Tax=Thalictrum thalictroides TaxID=46969 RepID=A0A7J6XE13_THATH|nr:hypothetical protein FRX31_002625 [Thalictrum thalictroides]